ncbi:MAG: znuA [Gemmataceae bacterium]|nr:znuA [Gemmataceae bacterium]
MVGPRSSANRVLAGTFVAVLAALLPLLGLGCGTDSDWPKDHKGPKVAVSFAPLYCFASNVAGDDAVVRSMMTTTGPHDFNPTDIEARLIRNANLLFINGLDLDEELATKLQRGSGNKSLKVINLGARIPADRLLEGECHHDHGHDHPHEHASDPHIWLSPDFAVIMTEGIRDELKVADPSNAANYDRRAAEYVAKLRKLKADGVDLLKDKKDRRLVTFHESLAYFAKDFGLTIEGVVQKKPGSEPNQDELNQLLKKCRDGKVRLIAIEPQYTANTSAETVLNELRRKGLADAAAVEIDPLETANPAALTADWYERKMRANIEELAKAMK